MTDTYETIVGMEIHVELKTKSKMFCGCRNDPFGAPKPNIYTCPVCLDLPGALPVPNRKAVEWTILLGLALGCDIAEFSKFDRKNYFYPDLPKGYQISQYDQPLATGGHVATELGEVGITRVHLEEDTGKLQHTTVDGKPVTLIDFNRSGVPLVEIVTEPDIRSGKEARAFLKKLHQTVRYLNISDADMEKGSMRLEPNISLRPVGDKELPEYKVEVKNINSFSFVKKAIDFEEKRQAAILASGKKPDQETRGYHEAGAKTVSQRRKETADDYRYFPEPDIPPMRFDAETVSKLRASLPELPEEKMTRFITSYRLSEYDAHILTESRSKAKYFEEAVKAGGDIPAVKIANVMINKKIDIMHTSPGQLAAQVHDSLKMVDIADEVYETTIDAVISGNKEAVADYKNGKEASLMFLLGQCKRQNHDLDPQTLIAKLKQKLR